MVMDRTRKKVPYNGGTNGHSSGLKAQMPKARVAGRKTSTILDLGCVILVDHLGRIDGLAMPQTKAAEEAVATKNSRL